MRVIRHLLDVPSTDPDGQRRARLLNILLLGVTVVTLSALLATAVVGMTGLEEWEQIAPLSRGIQAAFVGILTIFAINRFWSGWLASSLFLLLLTAVFAFTDTPQQVVDGRALFLFAIPIMMASVLLRPWASFVMATLVSLVIAVIALSIDFVPPAPTMLGFFTIALVAWLSARSLERALKDLRVLNQDLDRRVVARTRELAETLSKTQAILEGIADGVIVFDNDAQAILANPAIAGLLGWPTDEIVGCDVETLIGDNVSSNDRDVLIDLLRSGEMASPAGVKFEWGDKTLSVSAATVSLNTGEIIGIVAVFRDFTREAEIDRMKSSFMSTASHELRTPLNAILGYTDMLQEGVCGPISERQRGTLERIAVNTDRLLSLVSNLLDQAQIEAGMLMLNVAPFSLADLIGDVVSMVDVLARAKGLDLTSHIADDVPTTLFGDRQRLHQILINLVGNAVKFTEEGSVSIRAYRADAERWALKVADTGCGISLEAQEYVFDPFRRADESLTREHTGTGLGLSIVKQLVDLMEGEITLESEVGRGSTFTVVLPMVPPAWSKLRAASP